MSLKLGEQVLKQGLGAATAIEVPEQSLAQAG